jgi:hypothetical protein
MGRRTEADVALSLAREQVRVASEKKAALLYAVEDALRVLELEADPFTANNKARAALVAALEANRCG